MLMQLTKCEIIYTDLEKWKKLKHIFNEYFVKTLTLGNDFLLFCLQR